MSEIVKFLYIFCLTFYKSFYIDANGNQRGVERWELKDAIHDDDELWKMTNVPMKETNAFILKYCPTAKPWEPPTIE